MSDQKLPEASTIEQQAEQDLTMLLDAFQKANKDIDAKTLSVFFISMARHLHSYNASLTSICNALVAAMTREQKIRVVSWIDNEIARAKGERQKDEKFFQQIQSHLMKFRQLVNNLEKADRKKSTTPPSGMAH